MKFEHSNNEPVNTDKLSDADSILVEKTKELFDLYQQYNRQCYLFGECKSVVDCERENTIFYNIGFDHLDIKNMMLNIPIDKDGDIILTNPRSAKFVEKLDACIGSISKWKLKIISVLC